MRSPLLNSNPSRRYSHKTTLEESPHPPYWTTIKSKRNLFFQQNLMSHDMLEKIPNMLHWPIELHLPILQHHNKPATVIQQYCDWKWNLLPPCCFAPGLSCMMERERRVVDAVDVVASVSSMAILLFDAEHWVTHGKLLDLQSTDVNSLVTELRGICSGAALNII